MAQIENMFNRTCLSLGSNALLPCRSGRLPHYQKHDLFFGKLPKIAGWQPALPRTAKTSLFGYPRNPVNAVLFRYSVAAESTKPLHLEFADHGPGADQDNAGFPL